MRSHKQPRQTSQSTCNATAYLGRRRRLRFPCKFCAARANRTCSNCREHATRTRRPVLRFTHARPGHTPRSIRKRVAGAFRSFTEAWFCGCYKCVAGPGPIVLSIWRALYQCAVRSFSYGCRFRIPVGLGCRFALSLLIMMEVAGIREQSGKSKGGWFARPRVERGSTSPRPSSSTLVLERTGLGSRSSRADSHISRWN